MCGEEERKWEIGVCMEELAGSKERLWVECLCCWRNEWSEMGTWCLFITSDAIRSSTVACGRQAVKDAMSIWKRAHSFGAKVCGEQEL